MTATFVSGATAADGASYTTDTATNKLLVWVPIGYRGGTTTGSAQTYNSVSMTEREDVSNDITPGNGDPTLNISDLAAPDSGSNTLDLTWSSALTAETGYAMTLAGVDQITPFDSSNSATYGVDNTPSFTINAPANSCIVYVKFHGSSAAPGWTAPTGFTERFSNAMITSPAYREVKIYTRDVTTALTSFSLGADTTGTAQGGVHGYAIYNEDGGGGVSIPVIINHLRNQGIS